MEIITENGKQFKVSDDRRVKSIYSDKVKSAPKPVTMSILTAKQFQKLVLEKLGIETEA